MPNSETGIRGGRGPLCASFSPLFSQRCVACCTVLYVTHTGRQGGRHTREVHHLQRAYREAYTEVSHLGIQGGIYREVYT